MRVLAWSAALLFLIGAIWSAILLERAVTAHALDAGNAAAPAVPTRFPDALEATVEQAFKKVGERLRVRGGEVGGSIARLAESDLVRLLAHWDRSPGLRLDIRRWIEDELRVTRASQRLDALILVTQEGDVFVPDGGIPPEDESPENQAALERLRQMAAPFFRSASAGEGFQTFPSQCVARVSIPGGGSPLSGGHVYLTGAAPVWTRPDAPRAIALGGVSLVSLAPELNSLLGDASKKLVWSVLEKTSANDLGWLFLAGERSGTRVPGSMLRAVADAPGAIDCMGLSEDSPRAGRWIAIRARDETFLGGWGLELRGTEVARLLSPPAPAASAAAAPLPLLDRLLGEIPGDPVLCSVLSLAAVFLTLWIILCFVLLLRRRASRRMAVVRTLPSAGPVVPPPPTAQRGARGQDDILSQFEVNWKTFASYTSDIIQQKIQELEQAPQRGVHEVREQVERLASALSEVKKDLSDARSELKTSTHGVVEKVAHIVEEKSALGEKGDSILKKMESDFDQANSRFSELSQKVVALTNVFSESQSREIETRVAEEVARLEAEWTSRLANFTAELEAAKTQGEELLQSIAESDKVEAELREEVRQARLKEACLLKALDETKSELESLREASEGSASRQLEAEEELEAARARAEELREEKELLEESLQAQQSAEESAARRAGELEASLQDAMRDLETARAIEEESRALIERSMAERKESEATAREAAAAAEAARAAHDEVTREVESLQRRAETADLEVASLRDRVNELERERQTLEEAQARLSSSLADAERLAEERELEGRQALESLQQRRAEETARLEDELRDERQRREEVEATLRSVNAALRQDSETLARVQREFDALHCRVGQMEMDRDTARKRLAAREDEFRSSKEALEEALQTSLSELKVLRSAQAEAPASVPGPALEEKQRLLEEAERRAADAESRLSREAERVRELEAAEARFRTQQSAGETELRARLKELERRAEEAERARKAAESEARRLAREVAAERKSSEASQDVVTRLSGLEAERRELMESLDRVSQDLETLRSETDGLRRIHSTLVEGDVASAIVAVDAGLKVFAWNQRAARLWGRSLAAVGGLGLAEALGAPPGSEVPEAARRVLAGKGPQSVTPPAVKDRDGCVRHLRVDCEPIQDPTGGVLGVVLMAQDITREVEQEVEAHVQAIFSQSLTRSLPGALIVLDGQDRVISWNRGAEELFGVEEDEVLGAELFGLATPLAKPSFQKYFETSKKDRAAHRIRLRFEQKGVPGQFQLTQAPFYGKDDSVRGTILLISEALEPAELKR